VTQTAVQRFYRYHAHVYDGTRWLILHRRQQAVACLQLRPDSQVLDVGCGTGLNFRHILTRLDPRHATLTAVDFSADMLHRAARRVARNGWTNVRLIHADATTLALGRTCDAALLAYSLSMIPDWRTALRRVVEHLRPGGRLVLLDFGRFDGWGPLAPLWRGWLRLNHVETLRPYELALRDLLVDVEVQRWLGDYCFIASGRRPA